MKTTGLKIFLFLFLSQMAIMLCAQSLTEEKYYVNGDEHWFVEVPIWIPGFRGQLSYGDFEYSSSGSSEEREFKRLSNDVGLEFYFVGRIAAQYNKLWIQADAFSGEVGSAFSYNSLIGNDESEIVNIKIQATIPRIVLGYSVWEKSIENSFKIEMVPYLGVRYVSFHLQSDVYDSINVLDVKPNWLEPLLGLYVPISYKRFQIEIQADFGGIENNNTWVISNRYRYRISKLVDVQLGWNLIRLHHEELVEDQELEATIRLFGPTAGVGFRF